ncbi:hypothetical protein CLOHYLEM_03988 [[Clostridium] hylemonae DSM 15053]|uniref:Uncharacterized protein n=1 Tax=[Clostridium] hylemonae DSM 15053 TaxID=553973 RepID=C0BW84_9FIRM|nr:hypothetical protein CLOHYLEM_03988 [[Clostridium] hylemonae DSM 15053]
MNCSAVNRHIYTEPQPYNVLRFFFCIVDLRLNFTLYRSRRIWYDNEEIYNI